jgi:hypothetical protein
MAGPSASRISSSVHAPAKRRKLPSTSDSSTVLGGDRMLRVVKWVRSRPLRMCRVATTSPAVCERTSDFQHHGTKSG